MMITSKPQLVALVFFACIIASALGEDLLACEATSTLASSAYRCDESGSQYQCKTFAVLRSNSYFSSLTNLSIYLGIDRVALAEANGFPAGTEFLPCEQPLLIPVECKCSGAFFEAKLTKFTTKGESFYHIAESLEGLTTCKAIREKNPSLSPWNLAEKLHLIVPLRCACPSSVHHSQKEKILLTYPVRAGDTVANLANKFNATPESIISASNQPGAGFRPDSLLPFSTVLIPLEEKPVLGSIAKPREPNSGLPVTGIPTIHPHKRKPKMWKMGIYIALSGVAFAISTAIAAAFLIIQWRKKKTADHLGCKTEDLEMQQLSLSVRTISDKKVSFEGSQDTLDGQIIDTTPHKMMVETYTIEQLNKATEDFNSANLIEGSVFHGRLNGKNLAIKRARADTISKIDIGLFYDAIHHHPNIIRLYGTCVTDQDQDSYLVLEYAKNGSLKDWLHGGLAMKSHFIASCYCFLTWNQRLKICLDVATALQFMHHIMSPCYVHRNIKSRNIFLDEEFNAKVGNFGMARCVEEGETSEEQNSNSTSQLAGWSKGYLAPEYEQHGVIAPSIDVFAYGVVLLEVLSGRTAVTWANEKGDKKVRLSERIKSILQSEKADELREWMDSALGENYTFDTAVTLANLARACVEDDPSSRPNAGEIVDKLSRMVEDLPEGDQFIISESSCKPLVMAAANNNNSNSNI